MKINFNVGLIYDFLKNENMSKNKFCKLCDISATTLKNILEETGNVKMVSYIKISRVMNVNYQDMIK